MRYYADHKDMGGSAAKAKMVKAIKEVKRLNKEKRDKAKRPEPIKETAQ